MAAIHAVFIGLALWLLGVPLLVPLVILVFLAAYVPLIGILVAGALAILVTLGTKGWIAAVILLVVFLVENQIESHLLQPLVVGRIVRLHPLAIILVLAVGGIVAGIAGAIVAVPAAAALCYAWPHLRRPPAVEVGPPGTRPRGGSGPREGTVTAMSTDTRRPSGCSIQRLDPGLPLPERAHPGDAGADLFAAADVELAPGQRAVVPTGSRSRCPTATPRSCTRAPAWRPGTASRS